MAGCEARRSESVLSRDDWKKNFPDTFYLTGTIDWLHEGTEGTLPWVDDLKTGRWPVNPKTSKQLLSYLLVPWLKQGAPLVGWEGVVSITQWPKYPLGKRPKRSSHKVTGLDLAEHLEDLRWAVNSPSIAVPTEEHCRFCPCRRDCLDAHDSY